MKWLAAVWLVVTMLCACIGASALAAYAQAHAPATHRMAEDDAIVCIMHADGHAVAAPLWSLTRTQGDALCDER